MKNGRQRQLLKGWTFLLLPGKWNHEWEMLGLAMTGRIAIATCFTLLQVTSSELLPSEYRELGTFSATTFGRMCLSSAPFNVSLVRLKEMIHYLYCWQGNLYGSLWYLDTDRRIILKWMWLQTGIKVQMQAILMMVMNLVSDIEGCENSFQLQHTFDRFEVLAAELSLQWCDIVPPGMQFLAFWKKMKMLWPFGKSGTGHPMTQCNITEELNPQVHVFLNCNICDSRHCKMYSCFNELQAMYGDYVPLSLYGTITCMGGVAALYLGWVTSKTSQCQH